jgi:hypothetical protein
MQGVTIMSKYFPTTSKRRKRREALIPAANAADTSGQPQPDANSSLDVGLKETAGTPVEKVAKSASHPFRSWT